MIQPSLHEERYPAEYWFSCYSLLDTEAASAVSLEGKRVVYYDVETQKRADEVGGWNNADQMLVSIAITYDDSAGFRTWLEKDVPDMIRYMDGFDVVLSYNGDQFDSRVISHYGDVGTINRKSFDLAQYFHHRLKHRLKLDTIATATLGKGKTSDGLQALKWWKEGKIQDIIDYCEQDVQVLKDIVEFGKENGFILYTDLQGKEIKVDVDW